MSADTALKRFSAMNIACPWRGLNVIPDVTIPQGERQALLFLYAAVESVIPPTPPVVVVTTSTFAGFGGGFLGPYRGRKRKEWVTAPPITKTTFSKILNRVLIETLPPATYVPRGTDPPPPPKPRFTGAMTSAVREALARELQLRELQVRAAEARAAAAEAEARRRKKLHDDDEFVIMSLYGTLYGASHGKAYPRLPDVRTMKPAAERLRQVMDSINAERKTRSASKITVKTVERDGEGRPTVRQTKEPKR